MQMDKSFLVLFFKKELLAFLYQPLFQLTHVTLAKTSAPATKAWILRSAQDDGGGGGLPGRVRHSKGWYYLGSSVRPISASSTARAHWRPSRMAQTTSDWPRRMSPAAKIFGWLVR